MTKKKSPFLENESFQNGRLHMTEMIEARPKVDHAPEARERMTEALSMAGSKTRLRPRIAAIHEGITRNNTEYTSMSLMGRMDAAGGPSGVYSFTHPYPKPMLKNHDHESEPTGRITAAQYVKDGLTGKSFIMIMPEIMDPDTIEKVLDGRYMTVSIGCSTDHAYCSICGSDILTSEDFCGHWRGTSYEGKTCVWKLGDLWFDECSWVNVPADSSAQVMNTGEAEVYMDLGGECYDVTHGGGISESVARTLGFTEALDPQGEETMDQKDNTQVETPAPETAVEETKGEPETVATDETAVPEVAPVESVPEPENPAQEQTEDSTTAAIAQLNQLIIELAQRVTDLETCLQNAHDGPDDEHGPMESVAPTEPESQESDVVETPEPQPEQVEANDPAPAVVVEESVMPEPETVVPPTRIQKPSEFLLPNPGLGASNETYEKPQEKKSAPVKTRSELLKDIMAGKNRK